MPHRDASAAVRTTRRRLHPRGWAPALAALAAAAAPLAGQGHPGGGEDLGTVDFGVSCSAEVADDFDRAVALLHHMQYDESRAAFTRIAEADPECGMAHWGVAMTLFQPLWPARPGPEDLQRGLEEVERARTLGTPTPREAALVDAAEAFFREPDSADWWTRIRRWHAAMETAHAAHPDDVETSALFALSQLAAAQVAEDRMERHARAAELLRGIWERVPDHPGAVHYTIHANDVDARAGESSRIVQSYSGIAPEVPHALHMPSHIYVRTGDWPQVIDWNRRSADAALTQPVGEAISHHYLHAVDYLVHARLQRGEDAAARAALDEVEERGGPFQPTFISAFHLAAMPARYAVERRAWDEARAVVPRSPESVAWDRFWWPEAVSWLARGLGAVHAGDDEEAARAEQRMAELRDAAREAGEEAFADYIEVDRLVLASRRAHAAGQDDEALRLAREAVRLEGTTEKHPVTPGAPYPPREALGDLLMELDRPAEALAAYESSLELWPGRFNSLLGAARAAREAGDEEAARRHYRALLEVAAESDRPGLAEAREFVRG